MTSLHPSIIHINAKNLSESTIKMINKMVEKVNEMKEKTKREFEEKHNCQFDYEYAGVFPKLNRNGKWVNVPRGQIWKEYAEFLEEKSAHLTTENARLREALESIKQDADSYKMAVHIATQALTNSQ